MMINLPKKLQRIVKAHQKDEMTNFHIYQTLAAKINDQSNAAILQTIAVDEKNHYQLLKKYTGVELRPSKIKFYGYILMANVLGLTFSLKLLEKGEDKATNAYREIIAQLPQIKSVLDDEEKHEQELLALISEERLNYLGSIVLGLNDALVELTGALAGYTFALQNSRTIALIGLITGISAAFSMAASEFLSKRQEQDASALRSSFYTGIAYIFTVLALIGPYLLSSNHFLNLGFSMTMAILIILAFNFYIAVAKDLPFKKRFLEMAGISLSVATLSFGIGWVVRTFWGLDI